MPILTIVVTFLFLSKMAFGEKYIVAMGLLNFVKSSFLIVGFYRKKMLILRISMAFQNTASYKTILVKMILLGILVFVPTRHIEAQVCYPARVIY